MMNMKYKDGGIFQDRDGMKAPQDIDGGSAKPKKPKKKASPTKLPPLRKGQVDMPSDPDDGSVGMKKGGMTKGMHRMPDGKMMKDSAHKKAGGKVGPKMQAVAARAVKGHEKRMHGSKKMAHGGSVRGDGVAVRGKTKGRMV
jgi:hypothetical protein